MAVVQADSNCSLVSGAHHLAVLINRVFGVRYSLIVEWMGAEASQLVGAIIIARLHIHWKSCVSCM
jgi:hypothetical protein